MFQPSDDLIDIIYTILPLLDANGVVPFKFTPTENLLEKQHEMKKSGKKSSSSSFKNVLSSHFKILKGDFSSIIQNEDLNSSCSNDSDYNDEGVDFLENLDVESVKEYLQEIFGVGPEDIERAIEEAKLKEVM